MKMLSYFAYPFLFLFFGISCGKDGAETTIVYPKNFEYQSYSLASWKVFVKSASGFSEITPSGSFTSINTDATNVIDDFKEFIPFNKISLNSASSANLSNNIPGHDYNGLSFNVNYTNDNAGNLTFVINESGQTIDIWGTLTDSNETLLQYLSCVKYSIKKPNNTVTYSPFEFNSAKLPNFNLMLDSQQTQHNYQIGDTLAVMLYAAQFK
jgi:hypothetical protein